MNQLPEGSFDEDSPPENQEGQGSFRIENGQFEILVPNWSSANDLMLFGWLVEIGDRVHQHDRLAEIGIPGVSRDLESPIDGVVTRRLAVAGSSIQVGECLLVLRPFSSNDNLTQ